MRHVIDMRHPMCVDGTERDHALGLTNNFFFKAPTFLFISIMQHFDDVIVELLGASELLH